MRSKAHDRNTNKIEESTTKCNKVEWLFCGATTQSSKKKKIRNKRPKDKT
jgi:hypothetical protein